MCPRSITPGINIWFIIMMKNSCNLCSGLFVISTTAAENSVTAGEFDVVPVAYIL